MYLDPTNTAPAFYGPLRAGLRRAVNAPNPSQVLADVIANARPAQRGHYLGVITGFNTWWPRVHATGVRAHDAAWTCGSLTVSVTLPIGLRHRDGSTHLMFGYLKGEPLQADAARLLARMLEHLIPDMLPGATPLVVDLRRGKPFRLAANTNRADLDALLVAEAAKYTTHWHAADGTAAA